MSIPGSASPLFFQTAAAAGAAALGGSTRSLRFNSGDSAYLNRTPSSAGNQTTWTWSCWLKRSSLGDDAFIGENGGYPNLAAFFQSTGELRFTAADASSAVFLNLVTTQLFRDVSAWYHIVCVLDTSKSTTADRASIYINGTKVTDFSTATYPSQNATTIFNASGNEMRIGQHSGVSYFDGYMADIHFVDGSALDATSFGAFDDNGVWQAKDTSGLTFGTNGFHLKFENATSNAALGTDSSGNSNTFTVNNLVAAAPGLASAGSGFNALKYTGNGSSSRSVTGVGFAPDLVWIKNRVTGGGYSHILVDTVRTAGRYLVSNATNQESVFGYVSAFGTDGFTTSNHTEVNGSGVDYIAWCWNAGSTTANNTDGTITASVRTSTTYGFSIATWSGNSTAGATIGHGLPSAPKWILVKLRNGTENWPVYHGALGATKALYQDLGHAQQTSSQFWNNTAPTDSVFSLGSNTLTNSSGKNYVAYIWCEIDGFSKFSSYSGTGSSHHVECGFKPAYLMVKCSTSGNTNWHIFDNERGAERLIANTGDNQGSPAAYAPTFTDTGFTVANVSDTHTNASGQTYVFQAFAEAPDKSVIDSLLDVPTNGDQSDTGAGGEVSGNYCVFNPLSRRLGVISDGNLKTVFSSDSTRAEGTIAVNSGKFYWEAEAITNMQTHTIGGRIGICETNRASITSAENVEFDIDWHANSGVRLRRQGYSSVSLGTGTNYNDGDLIGVALDVDNSNVKFYKNGSLAYNIDFSSYASPGSKFLTAHSWGYFTSTWVYNFGARSFVYAAPSGYKTLCSTNLTTPTIADGSTYFNAKPYSGIGGTQSVTGLGFSPDLLWIKRRDASQDHIIVDVIRGSNKELRSNSTAAEATFNRNVTSFDSDGFSLWDGQPNTNGASFIAWAWDAGSSTASNTDGNVTTNVRASQTAGMSIVTYTGSGSSTASYGHGLGAEPHLIMTKKRDGANDWYLYFKALGNGKWLSLNSNLASGSLSNYWGTVNNTVFSQTYSTAGPNNGSQVAYCFAPVTGYSIFTTYDGTGSSDPVFVYCGFRPAFILRKNADADKNWYLHDSARDTFNVCSKEFQPHNDSAEGNHDALDILSNGFAIRTSNAQHNASGNTYIVAAFAENPFQANGGLAR